MSNTITQEQYESLLRLYKEAQEHIKIQEADNVKLKEEVDGLKWNLKKIEQEIKDFTNSHLYINFNDAYKYIESYMGQDLLKNIYHIKEDSDLVKKEYRGGNFIKTYEYSVNWSKFPSISEFVEESKVLLKELNEFYEAAIEQNKKEKDDYFTELRKGCENKINEFLDEKEKFEESKKTIWQKLRLTK